MRCVLLLNATILLAISFSVTTLTNTTMAFLFGPDSQYDGCDRLELKRCFENAFQTMRFERSVPRHQKRLSLASNSNNGTSAKRRLKRKRHKGHSKMPKSDYLCTANRPYLACFGSSQCKDDYIAHIASSVYSEMHGRLFPIQMFLAHRGYVFQLCSQTCSRESRTQCQAMIGKERGAEEDGAYMELVTLSKHIGSTHNTDKQWDMCKRFKSILRQLIQHRSNYCGEVSKCICFDMAVQSGVLYCNSACEGVIEQAASVKPRSTSRSANLRLSLYLLFFLLSVPKIFKLYIVVR